MDYQQFIGKEVLSKNQQRGQTVSFDKDRITVRFNDGDKIFNPTVAFSNHFLTFLDEQLNCLINAEFVEKEKQIIEDRQQAHKKAISRYKKVNALYQQLKKKDQMLKALFGRDFVYPPFKELEKQYRLVINKDDDWVSRWMRRTNYYSRY